MMMSNLPFLLGCIPARSLLAYVGKQPEHAKHVAILSSLIGISFIVLFVMGWRETATEAGGVTWWRNQRPLHGAMFLLFALYAFKDEPKAWYFLAADVVLGVALWANHRLV